MKLRLFNTETRQKEEVVAAHFPRLTLYTCGPTVYNFAHIGNFRTYVFEDLLRRTLKYYGFQVEQVMNLTDVDDKTIRGAIAGKMSLNDFTSPYKKAFFEDLETLRIEKVEHYPEATQYIPEMITMIKRLLKEGVAYADKEGNVYFSIAKFPQYGRLSHLNIEELKAGASERVAADEYDKERLSDFVLWKAYDATRDGTIFWESPFGKGRPGWHIECSAMATKILGESIDIHVGGVDNMFPHHENEIAQCEACTHKPFVKLWLHSEHLLVDHKKMSKSLGNFYTLRDLLSKGYSGEAIRFSLLSTHYRMQHNFTLQSLDAAESSLERIQSCLDRLRALDGKEGISPDAIINKAKARFQEALFDDLNISEALASLFDLIREINTLIDKKEIGKPAADAFLSYFLEMNTILGCLPFKEEKIPAFLEEALSLRESARASKNWKEADLQRDIILKAGYLIEDTPHGPRLKKKVHHG